MNYRAEFAKAALTGLLANPKHLIHGEFQMDELIFKYDDKWYANAALDLADELRKQLREREAIDRKTRAIR